MTTLVLPGDPIATSYGSSLNLGPGISASTSRSNQQPALIAIQPGFQISQADKGKGRAVDGAQEVHVQSSSKRYIPTPKDTVLGTIINRHADGYRVDLGSAQMASLDALAFEGATKRSKPNLKVGTLIYARVTVSSRDMEPEIECVDPATGKSDGFGELKGGYMVTVSLQLARLLYDPSNTILANLAGVIPFEISIGLNGRVWVKSGSIAETIALARVLEGLRDGTVKADKASIEKAARAFMA